MTVSRQSNFIAAFCVVKHHEMVRTTIVSGESVASNLMDSDAMRETACASESLLPTYLPTYMPTYHTECCHTVTSYLCRNITTRKHFKIINAWNEANVMKLSGTKL